MAISVLTNASVQLAAAWTGTAPGLPGTQTIAGTLTTASDISAFTQSVGVETSSAMQDGTTFGTGGFVANYAGLKSGQLTLNLLNDFAASQLDAIIRTTLGGLGATVYYDVKPTSSARGTSNPSYVGAVILADWKPITTQVGNLTVVSVTWPITGAFTTLTA
jgi:hypothetical protein